MVNPGPVPHVGGPIIKGQPNVLTVSMPQSRVSDQCICVGPPDIIVKGSMTVLCGGLPAARMGDNTAHGGVIVMGAPTVLIGNGSNGGGGGGSASAGMPGNVPLTASNLQAKTSIAAYKEAKPFCEVCESGDDKAAKKQAVEKSQSGSNPATKSPATTQKTKHDDQGIDKIYADASVAKEEIDKMADNLAKKHGGRVAKAPLKSRERALQKANEKYGGDVRRLTDIARNTIVVPNDKISDLHKELKDAGAKTHQFIPDSNNLGYSGVNASVKTEVGLTAEIQVNSPEMIYAKHPEEDARKILGDDEYDSIAQKVGVQGGLGHKFYEEHRNISSLKDPRRDDIEEESKRYYDAVRSKADG